MLKAMDYYMQPMVDRSLALRIESRSLAVQRDALLPKLVSGRWGWETPFIMIETNLEQLWGQGAVRVFISHKAEDKKLATKIKSQLAYYGIASFIAHEDIEPLKEWELEIERALFSMDLLIALLTEKFSDSNWTDQEIGVAIGRKVPIVPIRMGKDPYGFIGKYQAIQWDDGNRIGDEIFGLILKENNLKDSAKDAYIDALAKAGSFAEAKTLAKYLPKIDKLSPNQIENLIQTYHDNSQVFHSFGFREGLASSFNRLFNSRDKVYEIGSDGKIFAVSEVA